MGEKSPEDNVTNAPPRLSLHRSAPFHCSPLLLGCGWYGTIRNARNNNACQHPVTPLTGYVSHIYMRQPRYPVNSSGGGCVGVGANRRHRSL
jgi:hypothetical protein